MAISVRRLCVTPVKATRIREVDAIELDEHGARGDRAFYVVDADGALVNGKRVGALQTVVADYDLEADTLSLRFPDGSEAVAAVQLGPEVPTTFFGQPRPARVLDGPWATALSRFAGASLRLVRAGSAVDRGHEGAISIVSQGSLERLAQEDDETPVDPRRFRILIEVDGVTPHEEDRWVGREVAIGAARLRVHGHIGRCVTTTRGPDSGEVDLPTLKMLAAYRLDEDTTESLCFGVHGEVLQAGAVRLGDPVTLH